MAGTPLSLRIGFIAGLIGVGMGSTLGFSAAYYRGKVDTLIRTIVVILVVFLGLFFLTVGLDEIANPRLRRTG